jgi:hypothetical protein
MTSAFPTPNLAVGSLLSYLQKTMVTVLFPTQSQEIGIDRSAGQVSLDVLNDHCNTAMFPSTLKSAEKRRVHR